ncbi:MAG: outer membrane beta-barrel protein [Alphaproteobacteria bacterium]|nr:outer membrane beta-barrel protein [Alphaproteobacteria bacterium]
MKIFSTALLSLCTFAASFSAFAAQESHRAYYIGGDYEYTTLDYGNNSGGVNNNDFFATRFNGGNIHLGARFGEYLGTELGYYLTERREKNGVSGVTPVNTNTKLQGMYFDVLGFYPITSDKKLEALGSVGLGYNRIDSEITTSGFPGRSASDDQISGRLGAGLQYNLTDNVSTRTRINYTALDDSYWTFGAGVNFGF